MGLRERDKTEPSLCFLGTSCPVHLCMYPVCVYLRTYEQMQRDSGKKTAGTGQNVAKNFGVHLCDTTDAAAADSGLEQAHEHNHEGDEGPGGKFRGFGSEKSRQ